MATIAITFFYATLKQKKMTTHYRRLFLILKHTEKGNESLMLSCFSL
jgi:hypothetical protein